MNETFEAEMSHRKWHDMRGQTTEHRAMPAVTLDAIVIAKLVCLSEEARWRTDPCFFELQILPHERKSSRRRS
jgi:hypothetical protein